MATPDYDHRSTEVEWSIQPNYTHADNDSEFRCALTGFPKRENEVVYRGGHVDDFYGYYAIGQDAAEQLARLIGWVDPDTIETHEAEADEAAALVVELEAELERKDALIASYEKVIQDLVSEEVA